MGIKTRTVTDYYCDVCGAMCNLPTHFKMITAPGDRDIGQSYIYSAFRYVNPLKSEEDGVVCNECKKDYLKDYLAHLEK